MRGRGEFAFELSMEEAAAVAAFAAFLSGEAAAPGEFHDCQQNLAAVRA